MDFEASSMVDRCAGDDSRHAHEPLGQCCPQMSRCFAQGPKDGPRAGDGPGECVETHHVSAVDASTQLVVVAAMVTNGYKIRRMLEINHSSWFSNKPLEEQLPWLMNCSMASGK